MTDTRSRGNVSEKSVGQHEKDVLEKLFKSRDLLLDQQVISQLKKSLSDSKIVEATFDYYKKRLEHIKAKANKFKQALLRKYGLANLSTKQLIEKAKKYTKKYELSEGEFQMFINLLLSDESHPQYRSMFNIPATPMSRTLGYSVDAVMGDKLNVPESEFENLQKILQMDKLTKTFHSQMILQTLMYTDCQLPALTGKFDKAKNNAFRYIHPIIAALFMPKISYVESHMLLASISNIVKCKNEGKPIMTLPEYEVYWDLITDPNSNVCVTDANKTITDLMHRVTLQNKLWEAVSNLRQGKYYVDDAGFIAAIEACQSSVFDAPDLIYSHDEGTILRRLLNAFSLRPTVVQISTLTGIPVGTSLSLSPASYTQLTTIPMINLRLPNAYGTTGITNVSLAQAMSQPQWFIEGKTLVPKTQQIVHSREVLFFYVDRRYKAARFAAFSQPFVFRDLPQTMSGLDTINELPVAFDLSMLVGSDEFQLRSVVCVEMGQVGEKRLNIIVGSTALIVIPSDVTKGTSETFLQYDPQGAALGHTDASGAYVQYDPVSILPKFSVGASTRSFYSLAEKRGCTFMYVKKQL